MGNAFDVGSLQLLIMYTQPLGLRGWKLKESFGQFYAFDEALLCDACSDSEHAVLSKQPGCT